MKPTIHPTYHTAATFSCACGNIIKVGSTVEKHETELCDKCHPFYTGKQKIVDTARRVEKFGKRAVSKKTDLVSKKEKKARVRAKRDERGAKAEPEQQ